MTLPYKIRLDDKGGIDEIVAKDASVHLERMTHCSWFLGLSLPNDTYVQAYIGTKANSGPAVIVRHVEVINGKPPVLERSARVAEEGDPVEQIVAWLRKQANGGDWLNSRMSAKAARSIHVIADAIEAGDWKPPAPPAGGEGW